MSIKERLKEFLISQNISQRAFCRSIDLPESFVSSMKESTSPDNMLKIVVQYPQLNFEWLYFGIGKMLNESESKNLNSDELIASLKENIELLKEIIDLKDDEINRLKKALASAVPQTANVG